MTEPKRAICSRCTNATERKVPHPAGCGCPCQHGGWRMVYPQYPLNWSPLSDAERRVGRAPRSTDV